ncbi:MAG: class I SAM-dependent methyltransferase [Dokdonella sp.]
MIDKRFPAEVAELQPPANGCAVAIAMHNADCQAEVCLRETSAFPLSAVENAYALTCRVSSILKATAEDVRYAYRLLLGREPDEVGFKNNVERMNRSASTTLELSDLFMDSLEFLIKHGHLLDVSEPTHLRSPGALLNCQSCTQRQIDSHAFRFWASRLRERPGKLQRKLWEWCYIAQALYERGRLESGRRGLGFAVGTEPLTSLFAKMGCTITATDLGRSGSDRAGWVTTNQNAASLADLNVRGICEPNELASRASFRAVDMKKIPTDLRDYDFLWSSCAMEHLGSLDAGMAFVRNAMNCLAPGGIAVHTTELNCESDDKTWETEHDVVYRKKDLLRLASGLTEAGFKVAPFNFDLGDSKADGLVNEPPYNTQGSLKPRIGGFVSTSFGLIIEKLAQ